MPSDTYALSLEIKLNDMASDALSNITTGIDNTIAKMNELENVVKSMSTNITTAFKDVSIQINKTLSEVNIAHQQVGVTAQNVNTQIAANANTNVVNTTKETEALTAQHNVIKDIAATQKDANDAAKVANLEQNKALNQQLDTKDAVLENQQKINSGEKNYHTIAGITRTVVGKVQDYTKKIGTALLTIFTGGAGAAAGAAKAGAATGEMAVKAGAAAKATGGFGGSIDNAIGKLLDFSNAGMAIYGTVLVLIANALDNAAERAEKFKIAMFRATDSMNMMMFRASALTATLKATGEEVDEMFTALAKSGAKGEENLYGMAGNVIIFQKAMGISADTAAQFANRMRVVYGDVKKAQGMMAMLYQSAKEFGLSGEDMTNIMQEATESATTLATYGKDAVNRYTEGLVSAAAAAKNLGINTSKATQLMSKFKEPLSFIKILGAEALRLDPTQRMEKVLEKIPDIVKQYEEDIKTWGAGGAQLRLQARTNLDPEQLMIFQEQIKQKKIMANVGVNTAEAEKKIKELANQAQAEMTGVYTEMMKIWDNLKQLGMMIVTPLLPIIKTIFNAINGVLSIIIGFVTPFAEMLSKLAEMFDMTTGMSDAFDTLRTLAVAIGKVLSLITFVILTPMVAAVSFLMKGFGVIWDIIGPGVKWLVEVVSDFVKPFWQGLMDLIDGFKALFSTAKEGFGKIKDDIKSVITLGGLVEIETISTITKAIAALTAAVGGLVLWYNKAAIAKAAWNVVERTGSFIIGKDGILARARNIADELTNKGILGRIKSLFSLKKAADGSKDSIKGLFDNLDVTDGVLSKNETKAKGLIKTLWDGTKAWGGKSTAMQKVIGLFSKVRLGLTPLNAGLQGGIKAIAGFGTKLLGLSSGGAAAAAGILALKAAIIAAVAYLSYKVGEFFGNKIANALFPEKKIAEKHRETLKEMNKEQSKFIDDLANKRIAALDTEGKKRAENLKLWGLNNTQASIGAKNAQEELKMLESLAKRGKANADALSRLNELKKTQNTLTSTGAKQEAQAHQIISSSNKKMEEYRRNTAAKVARGYTETTLPQVSEIPGVKIMEGGPANKGPIDDVNTNTKESSTKLKEAVGILQNISNNNKLVKLLEQYLPKIATEDSGSGLSSVANNWM